MAWMPSLAQHVTFSALALLVYVFTTRAGKMRRPPTSAIAWVMGLALLPYLLLPLFLMFGQRKLKAAQRARVVHASRPPGNWAAALIGTFDIPAAAPADVTFHEDGRVAQDALWSVIEGARRRIDVCTFMIRDDVLGRELVARLTRRAQEGVAVRLMIDGAGAWLAPSPSLDGLSAAGGLVARFNPIFALRGRVPKNLRDHRKIVVADDAHLWSGGRNFAAEYFCGSVDAVRPWTDLSFDLQGPVAAAAARQFDLDWIAARGGSARVFEPACAASGASLAQFVPSGPDQAEDTVRSLLIAACFHAKERLLAVTPYFVPDESVLTALRLAAMRNVQITLVLPERSNHRLADFVRGRALRELAAAGARIIMLPQMVHAKAVVVDDTIAWCGSVNLDARSLSINYEAVVVFYGAAQIAWLAEWIETLALRGSAFVARAPGLPRDLAEGLLLTVAFQL